MKNIISNILQRSKDLSQIYLSKNKIYFIFLTFGFMKPENSLYTNMGNNAIDLLNLIQVLNKTSLLILFLIIYNFFIQLINVNKLELFLVKYLPLKLVNFYIKSLNLVQRSSSLIIKIFFILLLISNFLSYYYLDFFISNIDAIIEFYFRK